MQFDLSGDALSPDEKMEIYLEGSHELHWTIDSETGFTATNPVSGMKLIISRHEVTEVEFLSLKPTMTYRLTILVNPEATMGRQYTTVHTGDYNRKCDKLLESLYRQAQKLAQTKLLGDAQVSTG